MRLSQACIHTLYMHLQLPSINSRLPPATSGSSDIFLVRTILKLNFDVKGDNPAGDIKELKRCFAMAEMPDEV